MTDTMLTVRRSALLLLAGVAAGCGQPTHLQYDFSRSYMDALTVQADRGRPSVANSQYNLTGFEGILLRYQVTVESTDAESGEVEAVDTFEVE